MTLLQAHPIIGSLVLSFAINMFFFIFAVSFKTDKVTDFTYSLSFILITLLLLFEAKVYLPGTDKHEMLLIYSNEFQQINRLVRRQMIQI